MSDSATSRPPRFNVGDHVKIIGPVVDGSRGMRGTITDLLPVDVVYRYRVRFSDGTSRIYFGFELESLPPETPS